MHIISRKRPSCLSLFSTSRDQKRREKKNCQTKGTGAKRSTPPAWLYLSVVYLYEPGFDVPSYQFIFVKY